MYICTQASLPRGRVFCKPSPARACSSLVSQAHGGARDQTLLAGKPAELSSTAAMPVARGRVGCRAGGRSRGPFGHDRPALTCSPACNPACNPACTAQPTAPPFLAPHGRLLVPWTRRPSEACHGCSVKTSGAPAQTRPCPGAGYWTRSLFTRWIIARRPGPTRLHALPHAPTQA